MKTKSLPHRRPVHFHFHPGAIQIVDLIIAFALVALLVGFFLNYDDYGLTLNFAHRLILGLTSFLLIFVAFGKNTRKVFWVNILLGIFYLGSFLLGTLFGFPILVNKYLFSQDEMFAVSAPRVLDLGLLDFYIHGLMGFAFLICAIFWSVLYRAPQSTDSGRPN